LAAFINWVQIIFNKIIVEKSNVSVSVSPPKLLKWIFYTLANKITCHCQTCYNPTNLIFTNLQLPQTIRGTGIC
jgi:hypothetical protein